MERLIVLKNTTFLGQQVSHCGNRRVGTRTARIAAIHRPVGIDYVVIFAARALPFRTAFQSLTHPLRFLKG